MDGGAETVEVVVEAEGEATSCSVCTRSLPGITGEGLSLSLELGADGSASKTLCKAPNKCLAVFSVTSRLDMFRTK